MNQTTWRQAAHTRLRQLAREIDNWAPGLLYGATSALSLLPLVTAGADPAAALASIIGGIGGNLVAEQLAAWHQRTADPEAADAQQALAKALTAAAKADAQVRQALDQLLHKFNALETMVQTTAAAERAALVQTLSKQLKNLGSTLTLNLDVDGDLIVTQIQPVGEHSVVAAGKNIKQQVNYIERQENYYAAPTDPTRAARRTAYLGYVMAQTSKLPLGGMDRKAAGSEQDATLHLDAVYTALLTESTEAAPTAKRKRQPAALELPAAEAEREQLSAVAMLNKYNRLVLLGTPGSGKSTFVNFVALCLAGESLSDSRVNLKALREPLPVEDDAEEDEQKAAKRLQPWRHKALLPVRVILRNFVARGLPPIGESVGAQHVWQFIGSELTAVGLADFVKELQAELHDQGGLILFDGLDEVPDADQQREQVKTAVENFANTYRKCRVLVTSRPYAYREEGWRLAGFTATTLSPFSNAQIARFVERWYRHIGPLRNYTLEDAAGRADQLKQAIRDNDRLYDLVRQPLLLTLAASLHAYRGGSLPEKRALLYADAVDLLLEWWEHERATRTTGGGYHELQPSLQAYLQVGPDQLLSALSQLAYTAHAQQPTLVGVADIPAQDLLSALLAVTDNPNVQPRRLLEYLSQRTGLLLPESNQVYRFPHRTFQEYLAACHLTAKGVDYPDLLAQLTRADPNRWREVALLAAAKAAEGAGSTVWQLVDAFCLTLPADPDFTLADSWGAHLAGQALLESAKLTQLSPANRKKVDRVRQGLIYVMRHDADFPAPERALAGRTLAALGDPRFRADAWGLPAEPLLGFVEIPAGEFVMGSEKDHDSQAYADEMPQHTVNLPTYYIARYPVTVAQFRAFVEATGSEPEDQATLRDPDNHPVHYVTWHEALRYCRWLTGQLRAWPGTPAPLATLLRHPTQPWHITLPSEAEWEKAARGASTGSATAGQIYPWGDQPDPNRANYDQSGINTTSAVGCFSGGASPYGVEELSGNVWEWTRSHYVNYPYPANIQERQRREELTSGDNVRRVVRGGSFGLYDRLVRCAVRLRFFPLDPLSGVGWRLVVSPSTPEL